MHAMVPARHVRLTGEVAAEEKPRPNPPLVQVLQDGIALVNQTLKQLQAFVAKKRPK